MVSKNRIFKAEACGGSYDIYEDGIYIGTYHLRTGLINFGDIISITLLRELADFLETLNAKTE